MSCILQSLWTGVRLGLRRVMTIKPSCRNEACAHGYTTGLYTSMIYIQQYTQQIMRAITSLRQQIDVTTFLFV